MDGSEMIVEGGNAPSRKRHPSPARLKCWGLGLEVEG